MHTFFYCDYLSYWRTFGFFPLKRNIDNDDANLLGRKGGRCFSKTKTATILS